MSKKKIFICELIDNQAIETIFLVASKAIRETRNGDPYLALTLQDRSGTIEARAWDNAVVMERRFDNDDFVAVRGRVSSYRDELQITLVDLEKAREEDLDLRDYLPHSRWKASTLYASLLELIDREIRSQEIRRFLDALFKDASFQSRYQRAPAAMSNHHDYLAGLLEHSLSMARQAVFMGHHYNAYYPDMVDTDLLITGCIIHDMGKVEELTYGRSFDYSTSGRLIGHITLGAEWVARIARSLDPMLNSNLTMQLQHLILSHHGRQEYGSPVTPRSPEALLLHQLDMIDSRMNMCWKACQPLLENADTPREWSDYQRPFSGSLYVSAKEARHWKHRPSSPPDQGPGPGIDISMAATVNKSLEESSEPLSNRHADTDRVAESNPNLNLFGE